MLKFIIDTQLPPSLARFLVSQGFDAIHTTYFPNGHLLKDSEIVKIAIHDVRIIVTKDSDFFDNFLLKGAPPKVLLLQFGNIKNADLIQQFQNQISSIEKLFNNNSDLVVFDWNQVMQY
jgi:predicted nuclease of predicted toxin-antitoxin system